VPNPKGTNQHKLCPPTDDERVADILRAYHRRNISDRKLISKLLRAEHKIVMSEATVARRKKKLGLNGSRLTTSALPESTKRQLVLDQLAKDPLNRRGPRLVKEAIAATSGQHLTR
ncbi:hypothetical protein BJ138DRAFT_976169, partial [Hygrophoropsis aurantiaca]